MSHRSGGITPTSPNSQPSVLQGLPHPALPKDCEDQIRSDQISRSVMSDSLQPHESQHARPPCPSPTPGVHWDLRPWSQWCHPAISSSVVPFSSCPQALPASESFPMSQLFAWGGQSTGVSAFWAPANGLLSLPLGALNGYSFPLWRRLEVHYPPPTPYCDSFQSEFHGHHKEFQILPNTNERP